MCFDTLLRGKHFPFVHINKNTQQGHNENVNFIYIQYVIHGADWLCKPKSDYYDVYYSTRHKTNNNITLTCQTFLRYKSVSLRSKGGGAHSHNVYWLLTQNVMFP